MCTRHPPARGNADRTVGLAEGDGVIDDQLCIRKTGEIADPESIECGLAVGLAAAWKQRAIGFITVLLDDAKVCAIDDVFEMLANERRGRVVLQQLRRRLARLNGF